MKPGDKVIYAHSGGFDSGQPRIGYLIVPVVGYPVSHVGATPDANVTAIIHNHHIHPYSDALWAAWCQWLEDDHRVREQHKLLMSGEVPVIGLL